MRLIELLAKRQLMDEDNFGKTLFGVGFRELVDDENAVIKLYTLRFLVRNMYAPYRVADDPGRVSEHWPNSHPLFNR